MQGERNVTTGFRKWQLDHQPVAGTVSDTAVEHSAISIEGA